jgi:hypothetical protein
MINKKYYDHFNFQAIICKNYSETDGYFLLIRTAIMTLLTVLRYS